MVFGERDKPSVMLYIEDEDSLVGIFLWVGVLNNIKNVIMGEVVENGFEINASL